METVISPSLRADDDPLRAVGRRENGLPEGLAHLALVYVKGGDDLDAFGGIAAYLVMHQSRRRHPVSLFPAVIVNALGQGACTIA